MMQDKIATVELKSGHRPGNDDIYICVCMSHTHSSFILTRQARTKSVAPSKESSGTISKQTHVIVSGSLLMAPRYNTKQRHLYDDDRMCGFSCVQRRRPLPVSRVPSSAAASEAVHVVDATIQRRRRTHRPFLSISQRLHPSMIESDIILNVHKKSILIQHTTHFYAPAASSASSEGWTMLY